MFIGLGSLILGLFAIAGFAAWLLTGRERNRRKSELARTVHFMPTFLLPRRSADSLADYYRVVGTWAAWVALLYGIALVVLSLIALLF
jgi:hypothetical protein